MRIIRLDTRSGRVKDVADALRGSAALLAVLGVFVGALAVPVYFLAVFIARMGLANWLNALCCAALAAVELYRLVLIPEYLDRRDDRREREERDGDGRYRDGSTSPAAGKGARIRRRGGEAVRLTRLRRSLSQRIPPRPVSGAVAEASLHLRRRGFTPALL